MRTTAHQPTIIPYYIIHSTTTATTTTTTITAATATATTTTTTATATTTTTTATTTATTTTTTTTAPAQIILTKCDLLDAEDVARSLTVVFRDVLDLDAPESAGSEKNNHMEDSNDSDDDGDDEDGDDEDEEDDDIDSEDDDDSADEDTPQSSNAHVSVHQLADISGYILPVSSSTGANISLLWADLCTCAEDSSFNPNSDNLKHVVREHALAPQQRRVALLKKEKKNLKRRDGRKRGKKKRNGSRKRIETTAANL